ncbi:SMI1/KNR4 family protein [Kordia sp.]|uniref:SMI1/KNR4 family protein n=1 Tax=Kordia sp. TaxID=1965332 RepID=UPI003B5C1F19
MKITSLTALLNSCNYKDLDSNQAYEHGKEQEDFIRTLFNQFPDVKLEENWVALFFEYYAKLFDAVSEHKGFSSATQHKTIYLCSPHTNTYRLLKRLLWDYMLHTPDKLDALQKIRLGNKNFIESNVPKSLAAGWLISLYFDSSHANLTQKWNLNNDEEQVVVLMMQELLDQMQHILTHENCEFKDIDALLDAASDFRKTIRTHQKIQPDNTNLKEQIHQLNLIELIGFHEYGAHIFDSFEKFYKNDTTSFSKELLATANSQEELLSTAISCFNTNRKTSYLLLLTHYFLISFNEILSIVEDFKESVRIGNSLGNTFGFDQLESAVENLSICSEEIDEITDYLSKHTQSQDAKFILKACINDRYYGFIESAPEDGKFIKQLVQKSFDITASNAADTELKRLLIRWNMLDKNAMASKDKIEIPESLPQSVAELELLIQQLKLSSHLKFNDKASEADFKGHGLPDDLKAVYAWRNGCEDDQFLPLSEIGGIEAEVEWQYDNHMESEEEADDYEYSWPKEVDIREHIDFIFGVGRVGNGDFYFIDNECISVTNKPIVFRSIHDSLLTARAVANSLEEFIARMMIEKCMTIYGPNKKLEALLETAVLAKTSS